MNATIDVLGNRFETLLGDVHFRSDFDRALDSSEQLLAIGDHNLREYEKVETMDEQHQERIKNIVLNILAQVLQKEAMEQYGNTDDDSIRRTLHDWCSQPENKTYMDRLIETAKQSITNCDFTEEQLKIFTEYFVAWPIILEDTLARLISHLRLFPRAEAPSIASAIADIMKEANYAHG